MQPLNKSFSTEDGKHCVSREEASRDACPHPHTRPSAVSRQLILRDSADEGTQVINQS